MNGIIRIWIYKTGAWGRSLCFRNGKYLIFFDYSEREEDWNVPVSFLSLAENSQAPYLRS